jgi:hypothetical protein
MHRIHPNGPGIHPGPNSSAVRPLSLASLLIVFLLLLSVTLGSVRLRAESAAPEAAGPYRSLVTLKQIKAFYADERDRITTDWTDADTAKIVFRAFTEAGYFPVFAEGKLEKGKTFYRLGYKSLVDAHLGTGFVKCGCYTGIDQKTFDWYCAAHAKENYTLIKVTSFKDEEGKPLYCGLWAGLGWSPLLWPYR